METEPESVDAQKGTMKDVLPRCLKKNEAQVCTLPKRVHYRKEEFQPYYKHCWKTNIQALHYLMYVHVPSHTINVTSFRVQIMSYNNRCLFSQVKNKP
jgi:hypothetical protein